MTTRERLAERLKTREAARAVLGIAGAVIALVLLLPIAALFRGQSQSRNESLERAAIYHARAAQLTTAQSRLAEARNRAAAVPGLMRAETTSIAQSQLQSELDTLIRANGGSLRSAQLLSPMQVDGFDVLPIQYDIWLPTSRLGDFVYAIETHMPYLFIDNANIITTVDWTSPDSQVGDPNLEVRWIVRAYRWSGPQ